MISSQENENRKNESVVRPEFFQAKSEVVYLFQLLDEDRSLDISPKEIMNRPQAFLSSQVRTCTYRWVCLPLGEFRSFASS